MLYQSALKIEIFLVINISTFLFYISYVNYHKECSIIVHRKLYIYKKYNIKKKKLLVTYNPNSKKDGRFVNLHKKRMQ